MSEHLSWSDLVTLASDPPAFVPPHVDICPECRAQMTEAIRVVWSVEAATVAGPSPGVIEQALRAIETERAHGSSVLDRMKAGANSLSGAVAEWGRAVLVADSWTPSAAIRGATTAWPRVLVYETDDYSISFSLSLDSDDPAGGAITGQLVPREGTSVGVDCSAVLATADGEIVSSVSEFGEFEFRKVRRPVHLDIYVDHRVIRVAPFPDGHVDTPTSEH